MHHRYRSYLIAIVLLYTMSNLCFSQTINIIPKPNHIQYGKNKSTLSDTLQLTSDGLDTAEKSQLTDALTRQGFTIASKGTKIHLIRQKQKDKTRSKEQYQLLVQEDGITITAHHQRGLFYGIQTLTQLRDYKQKTAYIPTMTISDTPAFDYRGLHLDASRHFLSIDYIKQQLDWMAYYKLNTFHWHFTDGPGWRIEIKKYPLLTQIAAWRTHKDWKKWWATSPRKYLDITKNDTAYGGYYTQEQAKEIVAYAQQRNITVIPEIEMPGHSEEVLAVYPQLACSEKPYTQSEFCVGNEETFVFLENVLQEIIDIFPSKYIHIGGDEADKRHWKTCEKCQRRMQQEQLKNVDELQSYLIKRIEKFLNKKGKKLLGWDEILQGGLAPEATVMSWRGEEGGIKAAKEGHNVIMTPGEFCYFDAYQTDPATQPQAIGGYLPLEKVYSYYPIPNVLNEKQSKHILGVQANVWTEYMPTESHVAYMTYPRLLALSEVAWTKPNNKSWEDFKRRVNQQIPHLKANGVNAFTLSEKVEITHQVDTLQHDILLTLKTEKYGKKIHYTLDGTPPTIHSPIYRSPLQITDSAIVSAQLFDDQQPIGTPTTKRFDYHKAIGKKVIYNIPVNSYYPAGGESALNDGKLGGLSHGDGRWQGFMTDGMDVTIDLGEVQPIHTVQANFMQTIGPWIYFPKEVVIATSTDGKNYKTLKRIPTMIDEKVDGTLFQIFGWNGETTARYIRYQALPNKIEGGWVFLDEIVVW